MAVRDRGGERLRRLLADPERAAEVARIREGMREMDRVYEMTRRVAEASEDRTPPST